MKMMMVMTVEKKKMVIEYFPIKQSEDEDEDEGV